MDDFLFECIAWGLLFGPFLAVVIGGAAMCAARLRRRGSGLAGIALGLLGLTLVEPYLVLVGMHALGLFITNETAYWVFGPPILTATLGLNLLLYAVFELQGGVARARLDRPAGEFLDPQAD